MGLAKARAVPAFATLRRYSARCGRDIQERRKAEYHAAQDRVSRCTSLKLTLPSVLKTLLSVPPYRYLRLHLRVFTKDALSLCIPVKQPHPPAQGLLRHALLPEGASVIFDLGGVLGTTGERSLDVTGVSSQNGPIDVSDSTFRAGPGVWSKWLGVRERSSTCCMMCQEAIDVEVGFPCSNGCVSWQDHLSFALCPTIEVSPAGQPCAAAMHLICLARHLTDAIDTDKSLLPKYGSCPSCQGRIAWDEVIRSCYARKAEVASEAVALDRENRRKRRPRRRSIAGSDSV